MSATELMGVNVEVAAAGFGVTNPIVDRPLPGGGGHLVAERSRAILWVSGVGTFAVECGSRIRFQPEPGVPAGAVSMWLHGTVAALLLAQRGRFALHASVVDVDGLGVALTGPRRAGKSTTALRLTQRGHPLVTDDVSPLDSDGPVIVRPFARPVHVFAQTADSLGLDLSEAQRLFAEHPKLALPAPSRAPVPLGAIVVLGTETYVTTCAARVRGAQAHWMVVTNTYRVELIHALWQAEMFDWAGAVAAKVPVHVVTRPAEDWTVDAVADAVERIAAESALRP